MITWTVLLLVLAVALVAAFVSQARRAVRFGFTPPGSLPQARGFEAAAERHFGNPGRVGRFHGVTYGRSPGSEALADVAELQSWTDCKTEALNRHQRKTAADATAWPQCP